MGEWQRIHLVFANTNTNTHNVCHTCINPCVSCAHMWYEFALSHIDLCVFHVQIFVWPDCDDTLTMAFYVCLFFACLLSFLLALHRHSCCLGVCFLFEITTFLLNALLPVYAFVSFSPWCAYAAVRVYVFQHSRWISNSIIERKTAHIQCMSCTKINTMNDTKRIIIQWKCAYNSNDSNDSHNKLCSNARVAATLKIF